MSKTNLRREMSYSEFRKKNSSSKNHMSKSFVQLQNSLTHITDQKTSQIHTLQNQLQNLVRNRSLSTNSMNKEKKQDFSQYNSAKLLQTPSDSFSKKGRISTNQNQVLSKTCKPHTISLLNSHFQPIQQSSIQNEQDYGSDTKQLKNKPYTITKTDRANVVKNKQANTKMNTNSQKSKVKIQIDELNQMHKRLQSVKNKNPTLITQRSKQPIRKPNKAKTTNQLLSQRKLQRSTSQVTGFGKQESRQRVKEFKVKKTQEGPTKTKTMTPESHQKDIISQQQKTQILQNLQEIKAKIQNNQIEKKNMEKIKSAFEEIMKCMK